MWHEQADAGPVARAPTPVRSVADSASLRAGDHPGARRGRPRGRPRCAATADAPGGAHEVPGRGAARAGGAGPGEGRRRACPTSRRDRAAQAARRGGDACWPGPPPGTRRCSSCSPRTPGSPTRRAPTRRRVMRAGGLEPPEEPAPVEKAAPAPARRAAGGAAVGDLAPAGEPVPGSGLRGRGRADRHAGAPAGRLGAARPALQLVRARRHRRTRVHDAARAAAGAHARRPGADAAPGPGRRGDDHAAIARSCSPTSPGSARPRRRCSPPRRPTPTRCWSWCPTW